MSPDDRARSSSRRPSVLAVLAVVVVLLTGSCGHDGARSTATTGSTVEEPLAGGRSPLKGFGEVAVRVVVRNGTVRLYCMLLASDDAHRERGLMTVTDPTLGGYDGMVFEFDGDVENAFWMRNTPMALSIAYLDAAGREVSTADMAPCRDAPDCPSYPPGRSYRTALEVPRGGLRRLGIDEGSRVEPGGTCTPAG